MITIKSTFNPLIQTFFIPANLYPDGIYLDSVDLFFQSKDPTLPVIVHMGPSIEGLPDYLSKYSDSEVILYPSSINISATTLSQTNFKFPKLVYLPPGLHYLAIRSNSNLYNLYTAVQGENEFGSNRVISRSPYTGDLYYSSYEESKKIDNEDIKFVMYFAKFKPDVGSITFKNTFETISPTVEDPVVDQEDYTKLYDMFNILCDDKIFNGTGIAYKYKKTSESGILDSTFTPLNLRRNTFVSRSKLNKNTFLLNATLSSVNQYVSPVINSNRVGGLFVKNIINENYEGEDGYVGGNAKAKYVTKIIELLPDIEANDLVVFAGLKMPFATDVKVYYKAAGAGVNINTQVRYVEMTRTVLGIPNTDSHVEYKFTTPTSYALPDQSNFSKFQIKIVMLSSIPSSVPTVKELRVIALND